MLAQGIRYDLSFFFQFISINLVKLSFQARYVFHISYTGIPTFVICQGYFWGQNIYLTFYKLYALQRNTNNCHLSRLFLGLSPY